MLERPTWNEYVDMNVLGCTIAIVDLVWTPGRKLPGIQPEPSSSRPIGFLMVWVTQKLRSRGSKAGLVSPVPVGGRF